MNIEESFLSYELLLRLNYKNTLALCSTNKHFKTLCQQPYLWIDKIHKIVPQFDPHSEHLRPLSIANLQTVFRYVYKICVVGFRLQSFRVWDEKHNNKIYDLFEKQVILANDRYFYSQLDSIENSIQNSDDATHHLVYDIVHKIDDNFDYITYPAKGEIIIYLREALTLPLEQRLLKLKDMLSDLDY